jgi:hypothetical protein
MLGLPCGLEGQGATLADLRDKGQEVCALSSEALESRFGPWATSPDSRADSRVKSETTSVKKTELAQELCFLSAYAFAMLHHGHGFDLSRSFVAVESMEYGGANLKAHRPPPPP